MVIFVSLSLLMTLNYYSFFYFILVPPKCENCFKLVVRVLVFERDKENKVWNQKLSLKILVEILFMVFSFSYTVQVKDIGPKIRA